MTSEIVELIHHCAASSLDGGMNFPQIVQKLADAGIERYHADYSRQETTYYLPDGQSHVVSMPHPPHPIASEFSPAGVEAAVRQSQRNEHTYPDFVRKTMAAGCIGYFVCITGRRAIYFGRTGESHVEVFPPANT
jgi:uncharacterized protein YbcV (DUF1398 family)